MFDEGMKTQVSNKLRLESDLRRSLDAGELTLHYQPEVDIKTGRILGFEALARWPQADGSFIEPAEFIPIAEETGLIVPLGAWVLETACRQMAAWRTSDRRLRHLVMGVNVSPRQLQDSDQLVEQIRRNLRRSRLRPSALRIELTESTILGDDPQMAERLHRLKELGVGVAIDDFGTGYSSLTYLTRLAPDCIKIDRSFVSDIDTHEDKAAIVGALLSLGQRLGIDVTAEGVETKAEARLLESLGCTRAQGYLFYRPLEAEAAEACLLAGLSR
ncbi:MAG: EAL domain-containing protein [Dehalococcoidia bacterium]